ncbi:MAG: J domain-containing protein [Pseudomonadota bacterium]|nr:J domain-containing protein [Pseudomonadota bacterium]
MFKDFSTCENRPATVRACDSPGCGHAGAYRAPKSRELAEHYWFCLEHVRDYNKQWDYFAGMSADEIETHIRKAVVWERPSWPMGNWRAREKSLRDAVEREFFGDGNPDGYKAPPMPKAEREALEVLELLPPVTFAEIKAQYRTLVKRHHPDANAGSREAEETFKSINQAFAVLKRLYDAEHAA